MFAAFGMGVQEMVILLVIAVLMFVVPVAAAVVVILLVRAQAAKKPDHTCRAPAMVDHPKHQPVHPAL